MVKETQSEMRLLYYAYRFTLQCKTQFIRNANEEHTVGEETSHIKTEWNIYSKMFACKECQRDVKMRTSVTKNNLLLGIYWMVSEIVAQVERQYERERTHKTKDRQNGQIERRWEKERKRMATKSELLYSIFTRCCVMNAKIRKQPQRHNATTGKRECSAWPFYLSKNRTIL